MPTFSALWNSPPRLRVPGRWPKKNVELTIDAIQKQSPVLKEMQEKGEIGIAGGMYDVETGEVTFF